MVTTFADLEARVRGLESRAQRTEEDVTAIITTVIETREDVKRLKRAAQALLADRNITLDEDDESGKSPQFQPSRGPNGSELRRRLRRSAAEILAA